jgi:hypothetical protein
MDIDEGFFQHYFSTYRRTLPRRLIVPGLGRWYKTRSRNSSKTSLRVESRHEPIMDTPPTPLATTNGHSTTEPPVEPSSSFEAAVFRSYLQALLPPVIGATPAELESLFDDEFNDRVIRFASEGGGVIYVVKSKDEVEGAL